MDLTNQLLLPIPNQIAGYFSTTLTYICEHNDDGAMGIVINRPSHISLLELFSQLGMSTHRHWVDTAVLDGGPLGQEQGFVIHEKIPEQDESKAITDHLYISNSLQILDQIASENGPDNFLVALGYAGWAPGQLEDEVMNNCWLTTPASHDMLFAHPYESRLNLAAAEVGVDLNLIAAPGRA